MTRIALFAEGQAAPDARGLGDQFVPLWETLLTKAGVGADIVIEGFHKGHIVSMDPRFQRYEPLDLLIKRVHDKRPFDVLVLAFDREPRHPDLQRSCRKEEVALLLEWFAKSKNLPIALAAAAASLRAHYESDPLRSRHPARPRALPLDLVCMEPSFEGMLLADEAGLRAALGLRNKRVRDWPRWSRLTARPDRDVLGPAVACAAPEVRAMVRKPFLENKHGWARFFLERVPPSSPIWRHELVERLRLVLS